MKRDDRDLESRIAEAVRAAMGTTRGHDFTPEGAAVPDTGASHGSSVEGPASLWGALLSRLIPLPGPSAAGGTWGWRAALTGVNPIVGSLLRLFGGGSESASAAISAAPRPAAATYEFGFANGEPGYFPIDREASGGVREARRISDRELGQAAGGRYQAGAPTVIINVETIDSRSFLERTPEIAEAVRRAVLEAEGLRSVLDSWRE